MSAFMHDAAHIDAIVHAAVNRRGGVAWAVPGSNPMDVRRLQWREYVGATEVGRMLMRENAESMAYRYDMKDLDNPADGGTRSIEYLGYCEEAAAYMYSGIDRGKPWRTLPPIAILCALDSYEYQSCEHPEWQASETRAFCDALRRALISDLPGYSGSDAWAITRSVSA